MIHAAISPSDAYEYEYAEPDTGIADASSAYDNATSAHSVPVMMNEIDDGRARELRRGATRQHEDAGADDAADAEQHQIDCAERFLELAVLVLGVHLLDGLAREDVAQ